MHTIVLLLAFGAWPQLPPDDPWPPLPPQQEQSSQADTTIDPVIDPATPEGAYEVVRRQHLKTKRSLVVLIGATWCGPCHAAHALIGTIDKNTLSSYVDVDASPDLASAIIGGQPASVPVLVVYELLPEPRRTIHVGSAAVEWLTNHQQQKDRR